MTDRYHHPMADGLHSVFAARVLDVRRVHTCDPVPIFQVAASQGFDANEAAMAGLIAEIKRLQDDTVSKILEALKAREDNKWRNF